MPFSVQSRAGPSDKHELDITALTFHNNKLYSAADDGKIKVWEEDLKLIGQAHAHPCSVFSLTTGNDVLYSCSNDGTVKAWSLDKLEEKGTVFQDENEMYKVCYDSGKLYVGDDAGAVKIFENNTIVGILEIMHPIVELLVIQNVVYTARDLYVIISEINTATKKIATLKAIEGRAPVIVNDGKLCFTNRSGRDILIHDNSKETDFKPIGQIKDAHELIINALCGVTHGNNNYIYSGGWDKIVKKWEMTNDSTTHMVDSCPVDINITAMAKGTNGQIYIGGSDGNILGIKSE